MTSPRQFSKIRIDQLLVDRELVESRSKAKAIILAGQVLVNDVVVDKAGSVVDMSADIRIKSNLKYVSRGGLKLEKALFEFCLKPEHLVCLDIGASTGGFTDCLLQAGASKVYAVDVGYGQMHWKLQSDTRVVRIDRCNFREMDLSVINDKIDLVVSDVSFISILKIAPKVTELASRQNLKPEWITLFKPQFEVGREHIGKGGIVRDSSIREACLQSALKQFHTLGYVKTQHIESPITGTDGNIEYLIHLKA